MGEQNHLSSSSENGAKSSFLSTGEISETQIREKSSLRVMKPVLAESCRLETVEEAQREEHITPMLLRHFSSWKGATSKWSRALEKRAIMAALLLGNHAAPGGTVSSRESTGDKGPLCPFHQPEVPGGDCSGQEKRR